MSWQVSNGVAEQTSDVLQRMGSRRMSDIISKIEASSPGLNSRDLEELKDLNQKGKFLCDYYDFN